MKKTILALMFFLSIISFTKQYSDAEKREILKQFKELQAAVKSKNKEKIFSYIKFPIFSPATTKEYTKAEMKKIYDIPFYYTDLLKVNADTLETPPLVNYPVGVTSDNLVEYLDISADFIDRNNINSELIYYFFPEYDGNGFLVTVTVGDDSAGGSSYYVFDLINGKLKLTNFFQIT